MMSQQNLTGLIFNIERFANHDGPGIRTLVFMKGCPLRCLWCSTPQSQRGVPELLYSRNHCKACGTCVDVCTVGALVPTEEQGIRVDRDRCTACGACVEACLNDALELSGRVITVDELVREVEKDSPFYRRSGGGVTVGGGEPTMQHRFVAEFLRQCRDRFIHTALESCLYAPWDTLAPIVKELDLLFCDIKHMDDRTHKHLTGVSNKPILKNITQAATCCPTTIRIPTIPGYNDSDENIAATARFAAGLGGLINSVELLPYHRFGTHLYGEIDREYKLPDVETPTIEHMEHLKKIIESCGIAARIGS